MEKVYRILKNGKIVESKIPERFAEWQPDTLWSGFSFWRVFVSIRKNKRGGVMIKRTIKAIIFDFDGVLYDSPREAVKRIIEIVRKAGYSIPVDIYKRLWDAWGGLGKKIIKNAFDIENDQECEELHQKWIQADLDFFYALVDGVEHVLENLCSRNNFIIGIVTNRGEKTLYPIMKQLLYKFSFDFIQSKDDYLYQKPDPRVFTPLIGYLAKFEITSSETIYVGDGPLDFLASSGSGLIPVSVTTGLHTKEHFLALGQKGENIISSLRDLITWLENFEKNAASTRCDCGDKKLW